MKYFVDEKERKASRGTCYFEFQRGYYHDECWLEDSINISDILWDRYCLTELFRSVIKEFDYYGTNVVTKNQWDRIVKISQESDPIWRDVIAEVLPWAAKCFEEYEVFTILGM